jgi:hypothetical protein
VVPARLAVVVSTVSIETATVAGRESTSEQREKRSREEFFHLSSYF